MSYLFYCTNTTMDECLEKRLFGNSYRHWEKVRKIKQGDPLFLLNLNTGTLYGPFRPDSKPQLNLDPYAFLSSGRNFPAQVSVSSGRVLRLERAFNRFRFLRGELRCRLKPRETVQVLMALMDEDTRRLSGWV